MLKAAIQKGISWLPEGHKVNYLFQKYVTKGLVLTDDLMDDRIGHCHDHLHYFRKYHDLHQGFTALELGTGWYPIVPIGLFLAGAGQVTTVDLTPLLRPENLITTLQKFKQYHEQDKLEGYINGVVPERMALLLSLLEKADNMTREELLAAMNIRYLVGDARHLDLPDASMDLINSNNTFEHIYPNILMDILLEFKRLSKPDGIMTHFIDMSDHFAHMDPSINIYHFLKYSDVEWKRIDNDIQPQNRLRISDYQLMYQELGIDILEEVNRPGSIEQLEEVPLAPRFAAMPKTEAAISHSLIVSKFRG